MSLLIRLVTDTVRLHLHGSTSEMNQREKIVPKRSANLKGVESTELLRRRFGNPEITYNPPIIIGKQGPLVTTIARANTIALSTNLPLSAHHRSKGHVRNSQETRQPSY